MAKINWLTVHERAPAYDAQYSKPSALLYCCLGHAPPTERAVKPHGAYLALRGLLDDLERHSRMGGNHNTIKAAGDTCQVRIAGDPFDLSGVGVHGQRFVSRVTELPIHRIGSAVRPARNASYGDSLPLKEVGDGLRDRCH